ncbi:MAG: hypothetical protein FJZ86_18805 [Chloroflexi bacterium]|nr:hypothetical protein [Chloroflexota bacterium]
MKNLGLTAALLILLCTGCTRIDLKRLDQDMPIALAQKYNQSTSYYADSGNCYLIPLLYGSERVSKTGNGFQAFHRKNVALVLADTTKFADFTPQGEVIKYGQYGSYFTPLIYKTYSKKTKFSGVVYEEYSKKFLLGCFGTQQAANGFLTLYVLWVPCPLSGY